MDGEDGSGCGCDNRVDSDASVLFVAVKNCWVRAALGEGMVVLAMTEDVGDVRCVDDEAVGDDVAAATAA